MKRMPQSTPSSAKLFLLWRACETDFFEEYETALFCGVAETDFKADLGWGRLKQAFQGDPRHFWGITRTFGDSKRTQKMYETTLGERGARNFSLWGEGWEEARETNPPPTPPPTPRAGGAAPGPLAARRAPPPPALLAPKQPPPVPAYRGADAAPGQDFGPRLQWRGAPSPQTKGRSFSLSRSPPNSGAGRAPGGGGARGPRAATPPRSWAAQRRPPRPRPAPQTFLKCRLAGARGPERALHVACPLRRAKLENNDFGRAAPRPASHCSESPHPRAAQPARHRAAEGPGALTCSARPGPQRAGGGDMNGPPGQRGVAAPRGARGRWRVARLPAYPLGGPSAVRALAEATRTEAAVPAGRVAGLGPARYARGRRRCLIFLRRETCSAPNPRPAPYRPRPSSAPPRVRPRIPPPRFARRPLPHVRPTLPPNAAAGPRSPAPGAGDPKNRGPTA